MKESIRGGTCDTLHMIRTLAVLRETGQRANRLNTRTRTHTCARKEVDSLALTLRSTISYIEAADWTATTTIADITITKRRHPLVTHGDGYTAENGMRNGVANGDGFLNLAIKDPSWPG